MKQIQQNLLIVLALALCGLCAFQWYEQTLQRKEIITQNGIIYQKNMTIQSATNSVAQLTRQVEQMDASLTQVRAEAATNARLASRQKLRIEQLQFIATGLTNEITQYKAAVDSLQSKLKEAYAGIEKQNAAITNLVAQRNEYVQKYNDEVKGRNDVVNKYNDLVKQVKDQGNESKQ